MSQKNDMEVLLDLLEAQAEEAEEDIDREMLLEHYLYYKMDYAVTELLQTGSVTVEVSGRTFILSLSAEEVK